MASSSSLIQNSPLVLPSLYPIFFLISPFSQPLPLGLSGQIWLSILALSLCFNLQRIGATLNFTHQALQPCGKCVYVRSV